MKFISRLHVVVWAGLMVLTFLVTVTAKTSWRKSANRAFQVGETLQYELGWKSATAGRATLNVVEITQRKNRPAYKITIDVSSNRAIDAIYMVRDRFVSWMDVESLSSVGFSKQTSEGSYKKNELFFIDPVSGNFRYQKIRPDKPGSNTNSTGTFPPFVQDAVSASYYLRSLPLTVGKSVNLQVANSTTADEIKFNVLRKERLTVPQGSFSCVVLEPLFKTDGEFKAHPKATVLVWMSDDEKHIPVKIGAQLAIGEITAELVSATP